MEIYERYKTYFTADLNSVSVIHPLDDDATCNICLEKQITNHFTVPCCGKKYHTECLGKWLTKNDTCPNCRFKLITYTNRRNSSKSFYEPVKRDMNDYLYILWLLGANRVDTLDINKLLRGILSDNVSSYETFKRISGISYIIDLYNYMFFGQHLLSDEKRIELSSTTSKIMRPINLIPIFYLMTIQIDNLFSKFLITIMAIIYGLYYNMVFMSSQDIRSTMYNNFPNSSIGWIYYFIMFTFKFTILTPLCLLTTSLLLKDIFEKLIFFNIFVFFFEISIHLSSVWFLIRERINSKIFRDEMFEPTNIMTFINRYASIDQTISVVDVLDTINTHSDTIINGVRTVSVIRSMYSTPNQVPNPNSLSETIGETFGFRLPRTSVNQPSNSTFNETIVGHFPIFPTLHNSVLNQEYVNFSNLQTQDDKTTPIISDFTDEDLDFIVKTEEDDSTTMIEESKNDETVVKKRSGWF